MSIKLEDVKEEDRGILSPCGILCLGCDTHLGEGLEAAKKIKEIWEGWNMIDVGPVLGMNEKNIKTTLKTLNTYIKSAKKGLCPGCSAGGGPSQICGMANCVKANGFWTCAECDEYNPESEAPCPKVIETPIPMGNPKETMKMICTRYSKDTISNLKRCQEIGYEAFIKEAKAKVADGWRTWQIISNENVFRDAMFKK